MKQFLYMDTDIVNSIIAQAEKGLTTNKQQENEENQSNNITGTGNLEAKGKAEASFFKALSGEFGLDSGFSMSGARTESNTIKSINEKKIHDETFDKACQYINVDEGKAINDDYGEYIKLDRVFNFVDLDYLERVFSKEGILDLVIESEQNKVENMMKKGINREDRRNHDKEISEARKKVKKDCEDMGNMIKKIKSLLPYTKMIISNDGYLVPLDEKYFRVNSSSIGFMYDGQISCIGMITNIIGDDIEQPSSENIFGTMQYTINNFIKTLLPTKERTLCVVHPIAVFYDN